ncbi:MAG: M48 family metalloprotease [Oligoflexia bacterium]|nr:M48 family metalloprotease [Oligoflexia bacterium]
MSASALANVYTDLRNSLRRDVLVSFDASGLRIVDELGVIVAFWPYEGLSLVEEAAQGASPFRLAHKQHHQQFLTCQDPLILERLRTVPIFSGEADGIDRGTLYRFTALLFTGLLCYLLTVRAAEFLAAPLAQILPVSWEQHFSGEMADRIALDHPVCGAATGASALLKVTEALVPVVGLPFPLNIQVIDDDRVQAFSLAGGQVILSKGMLASMATPEEFIAVVAHELAHTADRHPLAGMLRSLGIGFFLRAYLEDVVSLRIASPGLSQRLARMTYTAEEEAKAYKLSAFYLRKLGVSATHSRALQVRLSENDMGGASFVRAHALTSSTALAASPGAGPAESSNILAPEGWSSLQNICSQVILPQDRQS